MMDANFMFAAVVVVVAVPGWLLGWALCRWSSCPRAWAVPARRLPAPRFVGLPLLLIVLAALVVAALAAGVVAAVLTGEIAAFDQLVGNWVARYRTDVLVLLFRWITQLGGMETLTAVSLVATGFLWVDHRRDFVIPFWLAIAGSQALTWLGKYFFLRPRPEFVIAVEVHSPSFPSAHAAGAMTVYGFVAYALTRDLRGVLPRFHVAYWSGIAILLVGFSRIVLGVHYASDVLLGFLLGVFWLLVAFATHEYGRNRGWWQRPGAGS